MGQAKQRGTPEQRRQLAMERANELQKRLEEINRQETAMNRLRQILTTSIPYFHPYSDAFAIRMAWIAHHSPTGANKTIATR